MYISLVVLRNNYPFHILHFGHIVHVCTVHLYDDKYVQCYDTLYVYSYMDTCKCTCITHTHNIYEMIFVLVFNLIQVLVHVYPHRVPSVGITKSSSPSMSHRRTLQRALVESMEYKKKAKIR